MWTPEQRIKYAKPQRWKKLTEKDLAYRKDYYRKNKEQFIYNSWVRQLKKLGCTVVLYEELFEKQNGVCAICLEPPSTKRLAVDHDHETGKIRGLLCATCNTALGMYKDSPDILDRAKEYLCRGMRCSENTKREPCILEANMVL